MTEELSQDSSRPQETSQDSGVSSEGQLSNPTGENTAAQNSQKSQVVTKHNNQNNKKYDLGVLFVHGIGAQKPGDTFNAMYNTIEQEFNLRRDISLNVLSSTNHSKVVSVSHASKPKNILFKESHWNGLGASSSHKNIMRGGGLLENLLGFLKACMYLLYVFSNIVLHGGWRVIFGFIILFSFIPQIKPLSANTQQMLNVLGNFIFHMIILILSAILYSVVHKFQSGAYKVPSIKFSHLIKIWYQQIDDAVRCGYSKKGEIYIQRVRGDLEGLLNESNRVLVLAHSMGGFLAYEALKRSDPKLVQKNIVYFNGVGSGLGPVEILRRGLFKKSSSKPSNPWMLFARDMLILLLFASLTLLSSLVVCINFMNSITGQKNEFLMSLNLFSIVVLAFFVCYRIYRKFTAGLYSIKPVNEISWKEYTHFADFVGNTSTYIYGDGIQKYKYFSNGRFYHFHIVPTYFVSGSILVKSVCDDVLDILFGISGRRGSYYKVRRLWISLSIASSLSMVLAWIIMFPPGLVLSHFGNFILTLVPCIFIMVTQGISLSIHLSTWKGHATWGSKQASNPHLYIFIILLGVFYALVCYFIWAALSVLVNN